MKALAAVFLTGVLFALGLGVSGMTDANNVRAFLDVLGDWDPALMFVMGGAIVTHRLINTFVLRQKAPLFGDRFQLPTRKDIDARLLGGAAIFGIGWGLAGYCPAPGLVSLTSLAPQAFVFVGAMALGTIGMRLWSARNAAGAP